MLTHLEKHTYQWLYYTHNHAMRHKEDNYKGTYWHNRVHKCPWILALLSLEHSLHYALLRLHLSTTHK
jgi:hypothetical protein